jgi:hypothetical protein
MTDTMPAPIEQRTMLFCQDIKKKDFDRVRVLAVKGGRTHAVMEDP